MSARGLELGEPPREEPPLGLGLRDRQCGLVRVAGLGGAIEAPQQLGTRRVQVLVVRQLELVDERQRLFGLARLGDRHGAVQRDDRRPGDLLEPGVKRRDLRPIDGVVDLERRDRRLEHVLATAA